MRKFNSYTLSNQAIVLSNYCNLNPRLLDGDLFMLEGTTKDEYLGENMFGSELVKLCSVQDLRISDDLKKWSNSSRITCIHGLGRSVVDYVIYDIPMYNKIINFDILNDHEPDLDHRPLFINP